MNPTNYIVYHDGKQVGKGDKIATILDYKSTQPMTTGMFQQMSLQSKHTISRDIGNIACAHKEGIPIAYPYDPVRTWARTVEEGKNPPILLRTQRKPFFSL